GVIHEMYKPIPGRFKDYIAMPKANMYQSLHTTLISNSGTPFEIQIRTWEMHRTAEYGIAAHWKYKENQDGKVTSKAEGEKMQWLREVLEWQKDLSDNKEFLSALKNDFNLFSDNVFCFTPGGDVKNLPAGSTPIDFAYSIHSAVGNKMVGARVNGKLVPIDYVIQNGDQIEIMTSQNTKGPSRDWLKIVKSSQAKNKILHWFRDELKEDNIQRGKDMLAAYCKAKGLNITDYTKPEFVEPCLKKYGFGDWDSICAAVGHGGLKEGQIINRLIEEYDRKQEKNITDEQIVDAVAGVTLDKTSRGGKKGGIVVQGVDDVSVHFAKCCSPVPGDEIVGFVTRGRGITLHRTDCVNVLSLPADERDRLIEAEWNVPVTQATAENYYTEIKLFANNRTGIIVDISRILTENKIEIMLLNARASKQGTATINVGFEVSSVNEMNSIIGKLRSIEGVLDIKRISG
ncbi:MAG: bifunctional (p)ppGpp synthetase/guanosine-3',5'-bis(diphosphate) 3'-pyrophosphohydrolase, partial [Lachnospiraceae bacterium]|nr:bifunctional (p)ppGpp synthetase/guanosine-3',5'-bis(diphosphate) 3'-pyrophosphohydrolase [Lachnospiraceae bacterium]